jgi:AcrR family transcriptional regulator
VVYDHFGDLPGLLEAMLDRESARSLAQLADVLPSPDEGRDPREALVGALRGYLEAVRAEPITWRLVLMPPEGAPASLRERITQGRAAVVAVLAQVVNVGLAPDRASPDPELTARLISAIADEAARLTLTQPDEFPLERVVDQARWLVERIAQ